MRILIYYTHYEDLGHSTRANLLAEHLGKDHVVKVINGGKPQSMFNVHALSTSLVGKEWYSAQHPEKYLDIEKSKLRAKELITITDEFKPDILITEYFPLGREVCKHEIAALIRHIKNNMPDTKLVCSVGYPLIATNMLTTNKFAKEYDAILVHTPEEETDYIQETYNRTKRSGIAYRESLKNLNLEFTGYITRPMAISERKPFYLVSRGSGVIYPDIIEDSIKAFKLLNEDKELIICAGPASSDDDMEYWRSLADERIHICRYRDDFPELLTQCEASISMCGYNTGIQLLQSKTSAILIPLANMRDIEQLYRVKLLSDHIPVVSLNYHSLSPEKIVHAIQSLKEKTNSNLSLGSWFDGLENTERILQSLMERK